MQLAEAVYEKCSCCGTRKKLLQDDKYGCDNCFKPIDESDEVLRVDVHSKAGSVKRLEFCSWACLLEKMRTVESDYFINLPFLSFDNAGVGTRPQDFWQAIRDFK